MKKERFDRLLKRHGYEPRALTEYAGTCSYSKEHAYSEATCYVEKDSHGKGIDMRFVIRDTAREPRNMAEFKLAEFDRGYLAKEARLLHEAFETSRK